MGKVLTSASRIVFIMIALTACISFFVGKLDQNNFMLLSTGVFGYFFTKNNQPNTTDPFNNAVINGGKE